MIEEWKQCTFGDVLELQRGYDITKRDQRDGLVPVYSSGGLSSYHDTAMADGPGVIMGRKGTLGRVFYAEGPYWPHDTTLWVRDFKGNSPRFVYHFLQTLNFEYMNVGSANPTLNRNHVHPLPVWWPPFAVQNAIGEVLGAIDDKIVANQNVSASALRLGESYVRVNRSTPRRLVEVADIVMGSSPWGEFLNEDGVGLRFYQGVRDFGTIFPTPRVNTSESVRIAPVGGTLLAVRAPVGEVNLAVEEVCIGRGLASISSTTHPATLHFCLRTFQEIWDEHQGGGTVFASVNGRDVREMRLPMPKDSDGCLERHLALLLDRAVQAEQESVRLAATRDELRPLLMSGKITVKDAEKTVEEVV